jgi:hypothetical protein
VLLEVSGFRHSTSHSDIEFVAECYRRLTIVCYTAPLSVTQLLFRETHRLYIRPVLPPAFGYPIVTKLLDGHCIHKVLRMRSEDPPHSF